MTIPQLMPWIGGPAKFEAGLSPLVCPTDDSVASHMIESDAKVVDAPMAKAMSFAARWGSACGRAFDAGQYLTDHPQFDWMANILKSRLSQPWTQFKAGE